MTDRSNRKLKEISLYLGEATNNVAETCALIVALQAALQLGFPEVMVLTDSELLARQVNGIYRVKQRELQWLHALILQLIRGLREFKIQHIPREENRRADRLANRAVTEGIRRNGDPRKKPKRSPASAQSVGPTLF